MLQECVAPEPVHGAPRALRAVKKIFNTDQETVKNEITANLRFPRDQPSLFVQFFGYYEREDDVYLCLEHMPLGIFDHFYGGRHIPEVDALEVTRQLSNGLHYLHEQGFSHGDIAPQNILVASMPPRPEGWQVKITDFGVCALAGEPNYAPWVDVDEVCDIFREWILAYPFDEVEQGAVTEPLEALKGRFLDSGISEEAIGFKEWREAMPTRGLTAAAALEQPWMHLRNWGEAHRLMLSASRRPVNAAGYDICNGAHFTIPNTGNWGWNIDVVDDDSETFTDPQAAQSDDTDGSETDGIWICGASRRWIGNFFGLPRLEEDMPEPLNGQCLRFRQSTHPTKGVSVVSCGHCLIERSGSEGQTFTSPMTCCRILYISHSSDGERLLLSLAEGLMFVTCDEATGFFSQGNGEYLSIPYPTDVTGTAGAISPRRNGMVAVGTESGQIWLGRPSSADWSRYHWMIIHAASYEVPGPFMSMTFSPRGDKIVCVSGTANRTVVSVSNAASLPMGRVSTEVCGAVSAVLSPENDRVFVSGWNPVAGEAWAEEFAVGCLDGGCSECTETRPLNRRW